MINKNKKHAYQRIEKEMVTNMRVVLTPGLSFLGKPTTSYTTRHGSFSHYNFTLSLSNYRSDSLFDFSLF